MEKEALRFYIKSRNILGLNATAIHEKLTPAYGPKVLSYSTVQKWTKTFNEGKMEISHKLTSDQKQQRVNFCRENLKRFR